MTKTKTFVSKSTDETARFAKKYVENLLKSMDNCGKLATIVALKGDLGSGKTTFVKAVAEALGVQKTIASPTFVLEKVYKIKKTGGFNCFFTRLIHIDAYRLENGAELLTLGWKALINNPRNIIFVEWPEMVAEVLPDSVRTIWFKFVDETTRILTIIE